MQCKPGQVSCLISFAQWADEDINGLHIGGVEFLLGLELGGRGGDSGVETGLVVSNGRGERGGGLSPDPQIGVFGS
jgi:hypothetical protein